jgi:hypothetical protein
MSLKSIKSYHETNKLNLIIDNDIIQNELLFNQEFVFKYGIIEESLYDIYSNNSLQNNNNNINNNFNNNNNKII